MSNRNDIIDGRQSHLKYGLIYTEVLFWAESISVMHNA